MICHKGQSSFLCLWIVTRMKIIGLKKIITSTRGYSHPPPRPPLLSKRICQKYKLLKRGVRSQLPSPPLMVHFTLSFFCNLILYKLNGFYTYSQWNILLLREVCGKSKWKFKMAFAIRRPTPPPLMAKFPDIFLPHFFSFAIESYIFETDFTLHCC